MIKALVHRLKAHDPLTSLLGAESKGIHPEAVAYPGPGISYEFTDLLADTPRISSVTFRIVTASHDLTLALARELTLALHIGDAAPGWWYLDTNIMSCKLNGGGSIEMADVGMFQRFITFDVKWRDK